METRYLKRCLGRCLSQALAEVAKYRPLDPIEYIAFWIYKYKKNLDMEEVRQVEQAELEEAQELARVEREMLERLKQEELLLQQQKLELEMQEKERLRLEAEEKARREMEKKEKLILEELGKFFLWMWIAFFLISSSGLSWVIALLLVEKSVTFDCAIMYRLYVQCSPGSSPFAGGLSSSHGIPPVHYSFHQNNIPSPSYTTIYSAISQSMDIPSFSNFLPPQKVWQ
ncbi:DPY30 domain-containing protein 1 isoform X1 [Monodelphis domestica]|uniref:DPY30 domain-containing protein 1 isoform X1 n=1 Tax=Monodelphis domestica TaxID=13616 RepID=UPI0024E1C656|nr:DPY30 domain-containing protein 1 isoform X1 [Monodelphis domestica]XP_056656096.1 DPY30 domain-containing protein 1 isoform X1 [Monodelphis domestica]XP_056656101.1 DPY30 domain-containing protein 1 isoform X1 [Monodelphis domestica]XP_056656104.1 DPY30 domain-containing protein 1 isoform X1 [Monodelphis domestica]